MPETCRTTRGFLAAFGVAAISFCALAPPAIAHHSFAMFDRTKLIAYAGTLKEFERTNPHSWLHVIVKDPATGRDNEWSFEMGALAQLQQQGLSANSLKAGDRVTVEAHPLKDGSRGGMFRAVHIADGRVFHDAFYEAAKRGYRDAPGAAPNAAPAE